MKLPFGLGSIRVKVRVGAWPMLFFAPPAFTTIGKVLT
jgi:hypothetical protein